MCNLAGRGLGQKSKRDITSTKFKYDWMIVACAASRNATKIYSDDGDIARCAAKVGIQTLTQKQLPIPAESRQMQIPDIQ
jgi:hypothetical protein